MWCSNCKIETSFDICHLCDEKTQEDIPIEIYWCDDCKVPIIKEVNNISKKCSFCGGETKYLCKDLRPVFPEERLFYEILTGKPLELKDKCFWANNSTYIIDGKRVSLPIKVLENANVDYVRNKLKEFSASNTYEYFDVEVKKFIKANKDRFNFIKYEATDFVINVIKENPDKLYYVSFSGGKDSTVVSDLVMKSLGKQDILHIYSDTTLEHFLSFEYVKLLREQNPKVIFKIAKNKNRDFYEMCNDIGVPTRKMRWCCTMFKTGPISKLLNSIGENKSLLGFIGVRKYESDARKNYNRIEEESIKLSNQKNINPILNWKTVDVWLYILSEKIEFNKAYRYGHLRVGCFCCPNSSFRDGFLYEIYFPDNYNKWKNTLLNWAKDIGSNDPVEYIKSRKWHIKQGGRGMKSAEDIKIVYTNCTSEENSKIYKLNKPVTKDFYNLFIPFGVVSEDYGRSLIKEVLVLDKSTNMPIISIQPFTNNDYEHSVKIKTLNVKNHKTLERMVSYQVRKYNACRFCLKCESVCKFGAININDNQYFIDAKKCVQCRECMSNKNIQGGCIMNKYLKTKKIEEGVN